MARAASQGNAGVAAFLNATAITMLDEDGFGLDEHPLPGNPDFMDAVQLAEQRLGR